MTNPLLSPSPLPFGLPPFAAITTEDYAEAVDAGLKEHLHEIQQIAANPLPATFENTAVVMERSGRLLDRAAAAFFTLVSADASDAIRELETAFAPRFAAHQDAVYMNRGLDERFNAIWLRANRNDPGIHTARMDHVGMLRLEAVEEALADTDGIESPQPFQIRTHHHRAELGDPRGVGSYTGTEDEVSHANKPMVRWLPLYSSSAMFPDQAGTAPAKCSGGFLV